MAFLVKLGSPKDESCQRRYQKFHSCLTSPLGGRRMTGRGTSKISRTISRTMTQTCGMSKQKKQQQKKQQPLRRFSNYRLQPVWVCQQRHLALHQHFPPPRPHGLDYLQPHWCLLHHRQELKRAFHVLQRRQPLLEAARQLQQPSRSQLQAMASRMRIALLQLQAMAPKMRIALLVATGVLICVSQQIVLEKRFSSGLHVFGSNTVKLNAWKCAPHRGLR